MEVSSPPAPPTFQTAPRAGSQALRAIGAFKLLKAVLFFAAAAGMFHLLHRDTEVELIRLLKVFRLSHDKSFVKWMLLSANLLDDPHKRTFGWLLALYGVLFTTEGIGLMMRQRWAEWFTSILTFTAIPIEFYEMWRHYTHVKLAVTIINILILVFLVLHLIRTTRAHGQGQATAALPVPEPEKAPVG